MWSMLLQIAAAAVVQLAATMTIPQLDETFEVRIEANLLTRNHSVDVIEYHDYKNDKGAIYYFGRMGRNHPSAMGSLIYNYATSEIYSIRDGKCKVEGMPSMQFGFNSGHDGHIKSIKDYWYFGNSQNMTFVDGNFTVRGIPSYRWTTDLHTNHSNYTLDFYFNKPSYTLAGGNESYPVRIHLYGQAHNHNHHHHHHGLTEGVHEVDHMYEIVFYRPGPIQDPTVFQTPKGLICPNRTNTKQLPPISDHFTLDLELIRPLDNSVSYWKEIYDFSARLFAVEINPQRKGNYDLKDLLAKSGNRPIKVIHDFNSGVQYVIDTKMGNCSMGRIPEKSWEAATANDHVHLRMKHASELFLGNSSHTYEGTRIIRGIPADVWITAYNNLTLNVTVESYYTQTSWTIGVNSATEQDTILLGMWMKIEGEKTGNTSDEQFAMENTYNIYEFFDGHPSLDSLDVGMCYPSKQKLQFMITLKGNYDKLVFGKEAFVHKAIKKLMSDFAQVTPSRIDLIRFANTSDPAFTDIWFTVLGPPPNGSVVVKDEKVTRSLTEAHKNLTVNLNKKGVTLTVNYPGRKIQAIPIVHRSLIFHSTQKPVVTTPFPYPTNPPKHTNTLTIKRAKSYSAGDMAGLAFGMLILGIALTLGLVFLFYKRIMKPKEVPYEVQM